MTDQHAGSSRDPRPSSPTATPPAANGDATQSRPSPPSETSSSPVTVYWRPGCGFCQALFWELDRVGLHIERRNIWEDEAASTFVRSVARGNETVPTVTVGPEAMVNPSARQVLAAVRRRAPEWMPVGGAGSDEADGGRLARAMRRVLGEAPGDQGR